MLHPATESALQKKKDDQPHSRFAPVSPRRMPIYFDKQPAF